ncbi:sensor histidine kinase [Flagellimonas nanhaiensis]|uniref:Signal transduction histidine kinase internal region domain-containing protein n=1 Tax=Flagellimonas nanhaiensis TaxID=2292706 RepID=A0A371JQI0_9FLAO|nr:histidine kinase [Allomuricauda nanhaiensis]RDY59761.1 hypothetical protein DX873_10385 [Allomuricauda nanhaiensis]
MLKQLSQSYKNLPISIGKMGVAILVVCCFFIAREYTDHLVNNYNFPFSWGFISLKIVANYTLWLLFVPWIGWVALKLFKKGKTKLDWVGIVLSLLIIPLLHRALATKLYDVIYYLDSGYMKDFFGSNGIVSLAVGSFSSFIELLVIVAVFVGANYQKQYLRNQQALIQAQISTLQMQLHPHFLFNTLHSISSMIDIDTRKAQKMLTKIGSLLRSMLENEMDQMTTVEKELDFIKDYLDLEEIRYADKMQVHYTVPKDILDAKLPSMILQPLVENAIKYGVVPAVKSGKITIEIKKGQGKVLGSELVQIQVSNTLENDSETTKNHGTGVGLKNIRQRLEGIYGNLFEFECGRVNSQLFNAKITLPYKTV